MSPFSRSRTTTKFAEEPDEKDQVEEAAKTEQNAEYTLTAITCVTILKIKNPHQVC